MSIGYKGRSDELMVAVSESLDASVKGAYVFAFDLLLLDLVFTFLLVDCCSIRCVMFVFVFVRVGEEEAFLSLA